MTQAEAEALIERTDAAIAAAKATLDTMPRRQEEKRKNLAIWKLALENESRAKQHDAAQPSEAEQRGALYGITRAEAELIASRRVKP